MSGFNLPCEQKQISLPEDTGPHALTDIEWWYCFSFLDGDDGGKYAVMASFFQMGELPVLKGHYLIFSLIDLTDLKKHSFSFIDKMLANNLLYINIPLYLIQYPNDVNVQKLYFSLLQGRLPSPHRWLSNASIENDPVSLLYGNSSMVFSDKEGKFKVSVAGDGIEANSWFKSKKPVSLIGSDGKPDKLYYYSFTHNDVNGYIKKGASTEHVTGKGWFDHQWGYTNNDLLIRTGWNWFGIQLEDGRELLINEFRTNKTGETFSPMANVIDQDGHLKFTRNLAIHPSNYWQSPVTGACYPLEWDISIPDFKISLNVSAVFHEQEMSIIGPLKAIWEGACSVSGRETKGDLSSRPIHGRGFLELVGYAQK